jgi:hypothetical protein
MYERFGSSNELQLILAQYLFEYHINYQQIVNQNQRTIYQLIRSNKIVLLLRFLS